MKSATKVAGFMFFRPRVRLHIGVIWSCRENEVEVMPGEPLAWSPQGVSAVPAP